MDFILWPTDSMQALRMRRSLLGMASYFMYLVPLGYMNYYGWLEHGTHGLIWLAAVAGLVNLGFLMLIRSGLNLRFSDPSLTLPQIAVASVLAVYVLSIAREQRGVLLLLYFTSFFFGVFRLNSREFLQLSLFSVLLYIGFFIHVLTTEPNHAKEEILHLLVLVMVLVWQSLIGGYIARLRTELRDKNRDLNQAMVRIRELLVHDELTRAFNRRYLMEILQREQSRVDRRKVNSKAGFSVCILDIDNFKNFNDCHGHLVGDRVLQELVERVRHTVRLVDWIARADEDSTFARYGGEEFVLVLPDTDAEGARVCAERIRIAICQVPFIIDDLVLDVSVSAGVSEYRPQESLEAVLKRADTALYTAKHQGRNRVVLNT
jgi:diguanylate cyclase